MKTVTEDIRINDTLNPNLWEDNELKEEVKEKLLDIVDNFLDILKQDKINIDVVDIRFLGSNANYNYTDKSDIDLHIVADFSSTPCEQNVMPQLYNAYKSIFNSKYDININGCDVEIYVEDVNQPAKSNGVYSLFTGWIKEPVRSNIPNIDWEEFEKQFDEWEDKYFDVVGEHTSLDENLNEDVNSNNYKVEIWVGHQKTNEFSGTLEEVKQWFKDNYKENYDMGFCTYYLYKNDKEVDWKLLLENVIKENLNEDLSQEVDSEGNPLSNNINENNLNEWYDEIETRGFDYTRNVNVTVTNELYQVLNWLNKDEYRICYYEPDNIIGMIGINKGIHEDITDCVNQFYPNNSEYRLLNYLKSNYQDPREIEIDYDEYIWYELENYYLFVVGENTYDFEGTKLGSLIEDKKIEGPFFNDYYSNDLNESLKEDLDYDKIYKIKELYKKAYDELIDNSTRLHRYREWASNSNNDYKEYIYNDLKNNKKDSALNLWYNHYRLMTGNYDLSYEDFLNTPITLYRATNVKEDEDSNNPFFSYAQNKSDAKRFLSQVQNLYGSRSGEIKEVQIKPKDTLGMLPSDENEIIVPNNSYQKRIDDIESIVNEVIDYANKSNVELPYDRDELLDLFKTEGRNTNDFKNQIIKYVDKRKGKLKESLKESNDYGYHAGDLGKSERREQQTGGRETGHFGTGTYFVGSPDKIKGYNDFQYGKGEAPHHIVDFSSYNLYKPSNNNYGYKLHDALANINNGYKYFTKNAKDYDYFIDKGIDANNSGDFRVEDIPEIVEHLNNLLGSYDHIDLPTNINFNTIEQEEEDYSDKLYDELKPKYEGTMELWDVIEDELMKVDKFKAFREIVKEVRECIEYELTPNIIRRYKDHKNIISNLVIALEGRHSKDQVIQALEEVNKHLDEKQGDSLSTIFMKALGYEGIDVRHLQDDGDWAGLDNTIYGSVIYDLKPETIVEDIDNSNLKGYNLYEELNNLDKIEFFEDEQIGCPVEEFLNSIEDKKLKAKTIRNIKILNEKGSELTKPLVDYVDDGIYELRTQQSNNITRIFYFFIFGGKIIMTNGYIKKTQKLNKDEFAKAKKYRDIYSRKKVGEK